MNEANFQGEFYHQARLLGLEVELEFTTPKGRLDAVVFSKDKTAVVAIVEFKKRQMEYESWQIKRYKSIGAPFILVASKDEATAAAKRIHSDLMDTAGVKLTSIFQMPRFRIKRTRSSRALMDCELNVKTDRAW